GAGLVPGSARTATGSGRFAAGSQSPWLLRGTSLRSARPAPMRSARSMFPVASANRRTLALLLVTIAPIPVPQLATGLSLGEQRHELSDPGVVEPGHGAIDCSLDLEPGASCLLREARAHRVGLVVPPATGPASRP